MAKKYSKKTRRSRRRAPKLENRCEAKVTESGVQLMLPIAEILAGVQDSLESLAGHAGLLIMNALLEDEVDQLVGERYTHNHGRAASRHGYEDGYIVFAGRKVPMKKPRVRSVDGRELPLERYGLFKAGTRMEDAVSQRVIRGVSTRNYEGALDAVCDGYGVQRSSVSRQWKAASTKQLKVMMERPLDDLDLVAMMIDGVSFHDTLIVAALGFTANGTKHVLGLWSGATENAEVCKGLLNDLIERGLPADRSYLFVLDGSKALHKAVHAVFGDRAEIQRCHVHKERNVISYLPDEYHRMVRQRLHAAWGMTDYGKAKKALLKLVEYLATLSASAARSLEEGLEETLTVHRLKLPDRLRLTFRTTNPIENCFSSTRHLCRNVKRWRSDDMAVRWVGTMLLEAEKKFRRVRGFREMPFLVSVLRKDEVDSRRASA